MLVRLPPGPAPASPARVLPPPAAVALGAPHSCQCPACAARYPVRGEKNRPGTVLLPSRLLPGQSPRISTAFLHSGVVPGGAPTVKKVSRSPKRHGWVTYARSTSARFCPFSTKNLTNMASFCLIL